MVHSDGTMRGQRFSGTHSQTLSCSCGAGIGLPETGYKETWTSVQPMTASTGRVNDLDICWRTLERVQHYDNSPQKSMLERYHSWVFRNPVDGPL